MAGMEPPADNILLNGHHSYDCSSTSPSDRSLHDEADGLPEEEIGEFRTCLDSSPYAVRVKEGSSVRLRLINSGIFIPFWFTVDNHTLEIVEMDGVEIEPISTDRVFLNPGQRYSAILVANQTAGNYLIRAAAARNCIMTQSDIDQVTEILSYNDVPLDDTPIGTPWDPDPVGQSVPAPWHQQCLDMPYDLPKPVRKRSAYDVGDQNYQYFQYQMRPVDGYYRTFVNEVYRDQLYSSDIAS